MVKRMKRVSYLLYLTLFIALFVSPWHILNQKVMTAEQEEKVFGKAALIFGTRVKDDKNLTASYGKTGDGHPLI